MSENILKNKIHQFIVLIYKLTQKFPKDEQYGLISQLRRAAVSIMLNFLEGFARRKDKVKLNFYEISFGSLKECKYILYLAKELNYITPVDYQITISLAEEIGAMLWQTITTIENRIKDWFPFLFLVNCILYFVNLCYNSLVDNWSLV